MAIDHAVSRAIYLAHVLERAVHDPGPWTLEIAGVKLAARRTVDDSGVTFAVAPVFATGNDIPSMLYCGAEALYPLCLSLPDAGTWRQVQFRLSVPTEVRA